MVKCALKKTFHLLIHCDMMIGSAGSLSITKGRDMI